MKKILFALGLLSFISLSAFANCSSDLNALYQQIHSSSEGKLIRISDYGRNDLSVTGSQSIIGCGDRMVEVANNVCNLNKQFSSSATENDHDEISEFYCIAK